MNLPLRVGVRDDVLEAVVRARSEAMNNNGTAAEQGESENILSGALKSLFALSEAYPDLKANENFLELQNDLVETENYLQFARRYYNGSVRDYNTMTESVPSNIVAGLFGFQQRDFFQKSSDEAANVPLAKFGNVE